MSKRTAALGKENVDPDLANFREPKIKKAKPGSRFATPLSEVEIAKYSKGPVVPSTAKNTQWAVSCILCVVVRDKQGFS